MYSKFDCYNFTASSNIQKETKLQKYLRSKNEHILEKCFDIKNKNKTNVVQSNKESLKQFDETITEKLPDQASKTDCQQQSREEITHVTTHENKDGMLSLQTGNCQQPAIKNESETSARAYKAQTRPLTAKRVAEIANKRLANAGKISSNLKHKPFKTNHTKHTTSATDWKSPFRTFITNGLRTRTQSSEFAYHLSRDELKFAGQFSSAMKPASESERQLLKQGQRRDYLMQRYEHSPVVKYNYPEATSWRIGWLQQKQ